MEIRVRKNRGVTAVGGIRPVRGGWRPTAGRTPLFFLLFCTFFAIGCGSFNASTGEDHGDLLTSDSGLILTQEEHEIGWGEADCFLCHNADNIHLVNRTSSTVIDIEAIQAEVDTNGLISCATCHGTNGL